jgi:hypothetical protein
MATISLPPTQFYESFEQMLNDENRIIFLETLHAMNYPFHLEPQPNAILQRFYQGTAQANTIVEAFMLCFPMPIMCREASYQARKPMTIIDCLSIDLGETDESSRFNRIIAQSYSFD